MNLIFFCSTFAPTGLYFKDRFREELCTQFIFVQRNTKEKSHKHWKQTKTRRERDSTKKKTDKEQKRASAISERREFR